MGCGGCRSSPGAQAPRCCYRVRVEAGLMVAVIAERHVAVTRPRSLSGVGQTGQSWAGSHVLGDHPPATQRYMGASTATLSFMLPELNTRLRLFIQIYQFLPEYALQQYDGCNRMVEHIRNSFLFKERLGRLNLSLRSGPTDLLRASHILVQPDEFRLVGTHLPG